jgi:hypothetical protein
VAANDVAFEHQERGKENPNAVLYITRLENPFVRSNQPEIKPTKQTQKNHL